MPRFRQGIARGLSLSVIEYVHENITVHRRIFTPNRSGRTELEASKSRSTNYGGFSILYYRGNCLVTPRFIPVTLKAG